ncbi:MAG TPA: serine/threonine-protein kinase [Polyangiaceae bacterium]|nr:serine/threonine-protein kinase [Polyangiaceae bacterium]
MSSEVAAAPEPEEGLVGRVIAGKYRVDRLLGRGGMGSVFQATNLSIGKRIALKFLNRDAARDPDATERFQREALAASVVESSHIVQIFDSGTSEDGLPFLVMELLSGEDLRARLSREGRLPVEAAAAVAVQLLRALVRAHAAGIVHRDLKPDNVFLCERDDGSLYVKIVDFGVSKLARSAKLDTLTGRGTVLGTAFYMSPEQAQAFSDVDGRTDLFSVGAILYECLAARPPHVAPTYEAVLIAICTKQAEDIRNFAPDVPRSLADVIHRALATDRSQRYASAQAMLDALSAALPSAMLPRTDSSAHGFGASSQDAVSGELSTFSSTSRAPSVQRTHRARTAVTAGIFVLAGFAVAAWWAGSQRNVPAPVSVSSSGPSAPASAVLVAAPTPSAAVTPVLNAPSAAPPAPPSVSAAPASATAAKRSAHGVPRAQPKGQNPKGVGQGLELSTREP